jgi:hypothetical protein
MVSIQKIDVPPELRFGEVVYSKNFGRSKVGIIRQSGTSDKDRKIVSGTVSFFDTKNNYREITGNLELLTEFIGSPLKVIGTQIKDKRLDAARGRYIIDDAGIKKIKSEADEFEDRELIIEFLEDAQENNIIKEQVKQLEENKPPAITPQGSQGCKKKQSIVYLHVPPVRINNYATIIREWLEEQQKQKEEKKNKERNLTQRVLGSPRSTQGMISGTDDGYDEYYDPDDNGCSIQGGRRRKSRRYKKTNRSRHKKSSNKSNRRRTRHHKKH